MEPKRSMVVYKDHWDGVANSSSLQHVLDTAQRLTGPGFILDQRKADVAVSMLAKTDSWTYSHFGIGQQLS